MYDSMMVVIFPSRSRFVASNSNARGNNSAKAGAPSTLDIVTVFRRALSQRFKPSSSRRLIACFNHVYTESLTFLWKPTPGDILSCTMGTTIPPKDVDSALTAYAFGQHNFSLAKFSASLLR